jgi:hypothetical protein
MKQICLNRVGCWARSILVPDKNSEDIAIPLTSSDYDVEIVNTIANVTLVQTYINPSNKFMEV